MKRTLLLLSALSAFTFGQMNATATMAMAGDGDNTPRTLKAGDATNSATFNWSGTTLTITGKGNLSKVSVTDDATKTFSAAAAGKVFTKDGETATAVTKGQKYDADAVYYGSTVSYGEAMTPSTGWNANYSMTQTWESKLEDGKSFYACYWSNETLYITELLTTENAGQKVTQNNPTTSDGKYYFCVANTADKDALVNKNLTEEQLKTITLLTAENLSQYLVQNATITASVDIYSKDAGSDEYIFHAKDEKWSYTEGQQLYIGTTTVDETAIASNANYFGTEHANYLESMTLSFTDYLPYAVDGIYSTVVLNTEEGEAEKAEINNEITRALVKLPLITTLNLQDTRIKTFGVHVSGDANEDPTFYGGELGSWSTTFNTTLTTFYAPQLEDELELAEGTFRYLVGLKDLRLGEGIVTIGEKGFDETEFSGYYDEESKEHLKVNLTNITFPNSLREIKKRAFNGQKSIAAFTFPAGLQHIEEAAFQGSNPKDVYFLGLEAPKVDMYAWGDNSYIANNSMNPTVEDGESGATVTVDRSTGFACRANYLTGNGWMTMLHYPTACTKAQAAKYTDLTRKYAKIVYGQETEDVKKVTDDNDVVRYVYAPGKEETELQGKKSDISSTLVAVKEFQNIFSDGSYGGNYDGGYADMYVGDQYLWPSMSMATRTTVTAQNNLLWDGVTTIGEGIKAAAAEEGNDTYYANGDGSEYIGLHQFVYSRADVTTEKTDEYPIDPKYGDGNWHTICLPISLTKAQMKEVFGATGTDEDGNATYSIVLCKFSKVDRTDEKLKLYFDDEQFAAAGDNDVVLKAHVSYMIKAKKEDAVEGEKILIKNYTMSTGAALPTQVVANARSTESEGTEGDVQDENEYWFISQYQGGMTIPQYSYFFSKSTKAFRFQGGTTGKWNAYTSVVLAPNGQADCDKYFADESADPKARLASIFNGDGDQTTGIKEVEIIANGETVASSSDVYDLNGRLVSTNGTNGLAKGLYVAGGKKVMVK